MAATSEKMIAVSQIAAAVQKSAALYKTAISREPRGFALITAIIVMALISFLAIFVVNLTVAELKISRSQEAAAKTYYLAESGIAEAIWRIKNNDEWKNNFETNPAWSVTYTRDPALYTNGSYQIAIQNTGPARGEIIATAFLRLDGKTAQRVVKTAVYKAMGQTVIGDNAEVSDGNIDITGSLVNVYNGSLFSNGNIIVNFFSGLNVDNMIRATGQVNNNWTSTINATGIQSANHPPAPAALALPGVSFDNSGDPNSYKARAAHIYTASQFEDLLWANQNLTLDGITYVTGDIKIKGAQNLIINGALVSDGNITVGANQWSCCWNWRCGAANMTVNQPAPETPAGLLAKRKINFELCLGDFNFHGLLYGNDQISILSLPNTFNLYGAAISRKLTVTSIWQGLNLTFDNEAIVPSLGDPQFSPVVTVEHWEEEY